MGMYDYVEVDVKKLPITEKQKIRYKDEFNFQSKDWDCRLGTLVITDKEELIYNTFETIWDESSKLISTKIPFHGILRFYDNIGEQWFEFNAKFTDGKLVNIKRIKPFKWKML